MTGFRQVFYGRQEPQNHQVLWLRPHGDHKSVDLLYYFNDGWVVVNSHFIINRIRLKKLVKFVTYDNTNSTLSFFDYESKFLFNLPLTNLDNLMKTAFTSVTYDADAQSLTFLNSLGETLYTIDLSDLLTAGDGITISSGVISVVVDPDSEDYLTLSESGLKIAGIDAIVARVSTAESDIDSLEERMTTAETDIDSLEERMTTAESDIDSLEERMTTAENDIDSVEQNISDLQTAQSTLETRMDTAETDIDSLETRMDTAESDIDSLEERVTTAESDIDALEERATTAESNITELQSSTLSKYFASCEYSERSQSIIFYAEDGTTLGTIDTSTFEKDGHLTDVTFEIDPTGYTGMYLHFTFNDDAGLDDIYVNLDKLYDFYTGSDSINVSSDRIISLNESYMASLLPDLVKYETDYSSGLIIGHTLVNNTSTDVIVPYASATQYGVIQIGNGISVADGEISADVSYTSNYSSGLILGELIVGDENTDILAPYATDSQYGVIMVGDGLTATNGILAVKKSADSEDYLTVDENGVAITGIDDIESRLTTAESDIDSLETRATTIETNVESLQNSTTSTVASSFYYDKTTSTIYLYAADGTVLSTIDATDFILDGMIDSAEMIVNPTGYAEGTYLHFVFNTDADKADIYINVSDLIDVYTSGDGVVISDSNTITLDVSYIASQLEGYISYSSTYPSGLSIGSLVVNDSTHTIYVPYATDSQYGVIKVSSGLSSSNGEISISDEYIESLVAGTIEYTTKYTTGLTIGTLEINDEDSSIITPYASSTQYGVIRVSAGLTSEDGVLSISDEYITNLINYDYIVSVIGGDDYTTNIISQTISSSASYTSGLTIGTLTVDSTTTKYIAPYASSTQYGVIKVSSGLSSEDGVVTIDETYIKNIIDEDYITNIIGSSYVQNIISGSVSYEGTYSSGLVIGALTIDSAESSVYVPYASSSRYGVIMVGDGLVSEDGTLSISDSYITNLIQSTEYSLPTATASVLGGVKIGDGIDVTDDGTISVNEDYIAETVEGLSLAGITWTEFD